MMMRRLNFVIDDPSTTNTISHVLLKNEEYPNVKYPNLPTTNDRFWGGGGGGAGGKLPMQIVNTKLPIVIPSTTNTGSQDPI